MEIYGFRNLFIRIVFGITRAKTHYMKLISLQNTLEFLITQIFGHKTY
jgi:hypothetical protein